MNVQVLRNPGQLHEVFKNCPDHLAKQVSTHEAQQDEPAKKGQCPAL